MARTQGDANVEHWRARGRRQAKICSRLSVAVLADGATNLPASPARTCAYRVVRRVFDGGAYTDRAFRSEAERARLEGRDRAFAQRIAYATVQRRTTIDHVLGALSSRPPEELDPPLRDALRVGVAQLLFLDAVPAHAAVSETVELAKADGGGGFNLANAVMRRAAREARALVERLGDASAAEAAVLHSHPQWIAELWWDALGPDEARALMRRDNEPAESAVRVNTLRTTREALAAALPVATRPVAALPEGLILEEPFDVHGSDQFRRGELMPQSRASMLVSRVLGPRPGERVLDLCAAPGAKATHLAALMEGRGEVVAVEVHEGRARALAENSARLGADVVRVVGADAKRPVDGGPFDRLLLDPPCSDLGTLQARPDVRWRKDAGALERLAGEQAALLAAAAPQVRPRGTLVYSTCTISPQENEERMRAFLEADPNYTADDLCAEHPEYALDADRRFLQLLPHRHGTDGFFIARLRRTA
jgi:16S rRNA (cytosine967-C5)-methyltransferase